MISSSELRRLHAISWGDIRESEVYLTFDIDLIAETQGIWPVSPNTYMFVMCVKTDVYVARGASLLEAEDFPNELALYQHTFLTEDGQKWVEIMSGHFSTPPYYALSDIKEWLDENLES